MTDEVPPSVAISSFRSQKDGNRIQRDHLSFAVDIMKLSETAEHLQKLLEVQQSQKMQSQKRAVGIKTTTKQCKVLSNSNGKNVPLSLINKRLQKQTNATTSGSGFVLTPTTKRKSGTA